MTQYKSAPHRKISQREREVRTAQSRWDKGRAFNPPRQRTAQVETASMIARQAQGENFEAINRVINAESERLSRVPNVAGFIYATPGLLSTYLSGCNPLRNEPVHALENFIASRPVDGMTATASLASMAIDRFAAVSFEPGYVSLEAFVCDVPAPDVYPELGHVVLGESDAAGQFFSRPGEYNPDEKQTNPMLNVKLATFSTDTTDGVYRVIGAIRELGIATIDLSPMTVIERS